MTVEQKTSGQKRFTAVSIAIFCASVLVMGCLRFGVYPKQFLTLSFAGPLLICLWHRDRRLLWSMAAVFSAMAVYKAVEIGPGAHASLWDTLEASMHVANIAVVAVAVHVAGGLTQLLQRKNGELSEANEEISRQNEELQQQAEELAQQNEEIQAQAEEFSQQNEQLHQQSQELQAQSEELQHANMELGEREVMLQTLIECVRAPGSDRDFLDRICQSVVKLFGEYASGAAVTEKKGEHLFARACSGLADSPSHLWPFDNTLTAVVIEEGRTAYIDDVAKRPDIYLPKATEGEFKSILATPLLIDGTAIGAVTVYSRKPHHWTTRDFELIEWVAAQCSLILEARRLREMMAQANSNLEETVQERTSKLQETVNELEHFSYTITHDMRAPLRAMQGFGAILKEECPNLQPEAGDYIDKIIGSAGRMDRLITDALNYSKAAQQEMVSAPVDLGKLLKGMLTSYPHFQPPTVEIEICGKLPIVLANEAGLTQCISNLLDNAVKFVEPGKRPAVKIRAERSEGGARIWFEDNGIGIPADVQPKIFEMFQRGSKKYEGTGIGLALVKKVVERMGGRAGCESEQGKGSRFWLELRTCP